MNFTFLGSSLEAWSTAVIVAVAAIALMMAIRHFVLCKLRAAAERTTTKLDDVAVVMLSSTYVFSIVAIGLYLGTQFLVLSPQRELLVTRIALTALLVQLAVWGDT